MDTKKARALGVVCVAFLAVGTGGNANAAPTSLPSVAQLTPLTQSTEVRYKGRPRVVRHHRRHGGNAAAAAVFGLFGAALAGAIASSRYDDGYAYGPGYYPYSGYGYPAYGPGYAYAPVYRGGGPRYAYGPGYGGGWRGGHNGGWRGGHQGGWRGVR